jgi:hypothetical protein
MCHSERSEETVGVLATKESTLQAFLSSETGNFRMQWGTGE